MASKIKETYVKDMNSNTNKLDSKTGDILEKSNFSQDLPKY